MTHHSQKAQVLVTLLLGVLCGCTPVYLFSFSNSLESSVTTRLDKLLGDEGYKVTEESKDMSDGQANVFGCQRATLGRMYVKALTTRWSNFIYGFELFRCDGKLSLQTSSRDDRYERHIVSRVKDEFRAELDAGAMSFKVKQIVAFGP